MILTPDELEKLTMRQKPKAQRRVLDALGFPYRVRPDGSLVVLRDVVRAALGGSPERPAETRRPQLRLPGKR